MPHIIEMLENEMIKRIPELIEKEVPSRPMHTLALAYFLSLDKANLNKDIKNKIVEKITMINDEWSDMIERELAEAGPNCTSEWEAMTIPFVSKLANNEISALKLLRWQKCAIAYCDAQATRPFYYTAFNHEIMRCATMYLCGESFNRPDLITKSIYMAKQLMHFVTPHGFWEEGPHHGTSLRYNYIMIHGLAWMAKLTNEEVFKNATIKLADFMATYAFPDGSSIGALDGRQSSCYSYKYIMSPGLEMSEKGSALFSRHTKNFFEDLTRPENDDFYISFFVISGIIYYKRFNLDTPKNSALPIDLSENIEEHTAYHDTVIQRSGKWVTCLSGHTGQIPKEAQSVYRLERQSRIEIYHEDVKLMIGGGHNKLGNTTPYANALVSSGFKQHDFHYGKILGNDKKANHAMYFVRAAKTHFTHSVPQLHLFFAHASIKFNIQVNNDKALEVHYEVENLGAEKIAIQLPIIVPTRSEVFAGAQNLETIYDGQNQLALSKEVSVRTKGKKSFSITSDQSMGVRYPNLPLITYENNEKEIFKTADFYIAILSHQYENPAAHFKGYFKININ